MSAGGYAALYSVNGLNFSFGRDGIVASVDALFEGGNGQWWWPQADKKTAFSSGSLLVLLAQELRRELHCLMPSEGQLIKPFDELVNVVAGVAIGPRVQSQRAITLIPQVVEIGVALGVNGNQQYRASR